jgi:hypothetical protein
VSKVAPGTRQRAWLAFLKHRQWFTGGGGNVSQERVTEDDEARITEDGESRVTEGF